MAESPTILAAWPCSWKPRFPRLRVRSVNTYAQAVAQLADKRIGQEVGRAILRGKRDDPRVTWSAPNLVKVHSNIALAGSVGMGGRKFRQRTFYAGLDETIKPYGWTRSGAYYRLTG